MVLTSIAGFARKRQTFRVTARKNSRGGAVEVGLTTFRKAATPSLHPVRIIALTIGGGFLD